VILDGVGRKLRDLFKLEEYLTSVSIVNKRTRSLIPAVVEKHRLLESIRRDLETLGLERRARQAVTLESIAAEYAAMVTSTATPDNTPVATRPQQEPPTPSDASTGGANR